MLEKIQKNGSQTILKEIHNNPNVGENRNIVMPSHVLYILNILYTLYIYRFTYIIISNIHIISM